MRSFAALLALLLSLAAHPLAAQEIDYEFAGADPVQSGSGSERFVSASQSLQGPASLPENGAYGPFRVLDAERAALVDATDARSPAQFVQMLRDWPQIALWRWSNAPEPRTTGRICGWAG